MSTPHQRPESTKPSEPAPDEPTFARLHVWQIQSIRDVMLVITVLTILWLGYAMSTITIPLLVALAFAYLFEPVIERLQRWFHCSRTVSVSVILGIFMTGVIVIVVPTILLVVSQTGSFIASAGSGRYADLFDKGVALLPEDMRSQAQDGKAWIEEKLPWSARVFGDHEDAATEPSNNPSEVEDAVPVTVPDPASVDSTTEEPKGVEQATEESREERLRAIVRDEVARQLGGGIFDPSAGLATSETADAAAAEGGFGSAALGFVGAGARRIWAFALGSIELGLLVFLVPFYFFYFATSYPKVLRFGRDLVPENRRTRVFHLVREMDKAVAGFVRGRLVISAILGTIFAVGWFIVGVPYSLALGLLVGVFCAVPYLSVIGVPIAVTLLAVEQFSLPDAERMAWWGILFWPALVYGIGQSLDDWVLTPFIQGKVTNLNPVAIVVAVLAGGSLAGLYGMLLAVPAAACVKIILRDVFMPQIHAWREGRASDPLPGG
ncbi:MAG: AI-2E family transporter [Planctomycetota bacterium]|nr:AI-2E family transporter [Planctomycetota bacterium]MDA1026532.1 AI-2E family transporter [Planctomycetota bacterium]